MDFNSVALNFLISFLATVVGILFVLWIERQRRPKLLLKVGISGELGDEDLLGRQPAKWTHIQIHNKGISRWLAWVFNGEPALNCRAWITFHHFPDGHRVFDRAMTARWSETPEPQVNIIETERGPVARLVNAQDSVDIPSSEYTNIDVVFRAKSEDECYGWSNESYLYNWRHPAWKLEKGRYIVKVRVKTGGREFIDAFLVANDVPYEDFRLEPINKKLKKHLR